MKESIVLSNSQDEEDENDVSDNSNIYE